MRPKPFERICSVCKNRQSKQNLIRFVKVNNEVIVDKDSDLGGKGIYICYECIKRVDNKALNKAFRCNVSTQNVANIIKKLKEF